VRHDIETIAHAMASKLFADEAWAALRSIDTILYEKCKPIDKLDAVRDVLADVIWRVE